MIPPCPDPLGDPEGYALYQEMVACQLCDGLGEDWIEDESQPWVCPRCGGTGIDPCYGVDSIDADHGEVDD